MTVQTMIDANQGQSKSGFGARYNAVTHGLTAKTALLAGEDAWPLRRKSRNTDRVFRLEMRSRMTWPRGRPRRPGGWTGRIGPKWLGIPSTSITGPEAAALKEQDEVYALAERLFGDRRGPAELYPTKGFENSSQPRTSKARDV